MTCFSFFIFSDAGGDWEAWWMPAQIFLWLESRTLYKKTCIYDNWLGCAHMCHFIMELAAAAAAALDSLRQSFNGWYFWVVSDWSELTLMLSSPTPVSINYYGGFMASRTWVTGFVPSCRAAALQGDRATWCTRTQHGARKRWLKRSVTNLQLTFLL